MVRRGDGHFTNREANPDSKFELITVPGEKLAQAVPGVWNLYGGPFKSMMRSALPTDAEGLKVYDDPSHALECVSQEPAEEATSLTERRLEAHVDMRYTAVFVAQEPASSTEGRLVIANDPTARNVE